MYFSFKINRQITVIIMDNSKNSNNKNNNSNNNNNKNNKNKKLPIIIIMTALLFTNCQLP